MQQSNAAARAPFAFARLPQPPNSHGKAPRPSFHPQSLGGLHARGYLHRDIKPGNILVDWYFGMLLADLGLMGALSADGTCNLNCGTPYFKAPEVMAGGTYGTAADWCAARMLYTCHARVWVCLLAPRPGIYCHVTPPAVARALRQPTARHTPKHSRPCTAPRIAGTPSG